VRCSPVTGCLVLRQWPLLPALAPTPWLPGQRVYAPATNFPNADAALKLRVGICDKVAAVAPSTGHGRREADFNTSMTTRPRI